MEKEFTALHEFHNDVEFVFGLKGVLHLYDVGRLEILHDLALCHGVRVLVLGHHELLAKHLHSKVLSLGLFLD